jgi:hypothetical protein
MDIMYLSPLGFPANSVSQKFRKFEAKRISLFHKKLLNSLNVVFWKSSHFRKTHRQEMKSRENGAVQQNWRNEQAIRYFPSGDRKMTFF